MAEIRANASNTGEDVTHEHVLLVQAGRSVHDRALEEVYRRLCLEVLQQIEVARLQTLVISFHGNIKDRLTPTRSPQSACFRVL